MVIGFWDFYRFPSLDLSTFRFACIIVGDTFDTVYFHDIGSSVLFFVQEGKIIPFPLLHLACRIHSDAICR